MPNPFLAITQTLLAIFLGLTCSAFTTPLKAQPVIASSGNVSRVDAVIPHCFIPGTHPVLTPTNLADCKNALRTLVQQPGFKHSYRFSRNPRRGVQVPKGWRAGDCLILLSCENDYDADTFSYADVLRKAKFVVDQCVDVAEGERPWGGVDRIGTVGSFYVSVNGAPAPEGSESLQLVNITVGAQSNMLYETVDLA